MKRVISLLLCIVLISGCTKQPAGEQAQINVLPSSPTIDNKVVLDPKSFPATNVINNNYNLKLIEFNGDKLGAMWGAVPKYVKYPIYTALSIIAVVTVLSKIFGLLAFFGLMTDHRNDDLTALRNSGISLKLASNQQVQIDQSNGHNVVVLAPPPLPPSE